MRVGTIVKLKRECLDNPMGTVGVVFYDYGQGFQAIFKNGNYDGFSSDEREEVFGGLCEADYFLEAIGAVPTLATYQFKNVLQVEQDFRAGKFNEGLK
jgi:hypothetical protein